MDDKNILEKLDSKLINGKKFYYTNTSYCMNGNSPCGITVDGLKHKKVLNYSLIYK